MEKSRLMIVFKLIISLVVCQFAGFIGAIFTTPNIGNWYAYLEKPVFSPPNWVFAPVWTILYLMMGISLFLILINNHKTKEIKNALIYFGIQLVFNMAWSAVFFSLNSILGGIIVIITLFVTILLTILKFSKISEAAAIIMIPYLVWVGFASILNISLYFLNR